MATKLTGDKQITRTIELDGNEIDIVLTCDSITFKRRRRALSLRLTDAITQATPPSSAPAKVHGPSFSTRIGWLLNK